MRWTLGVSAVCTLVSSASMANPSSSEGSHRLGVEIDLVQPFIPTVHIIRPKLTWTMWGASGAHRGDLIVGAFIRPHIEHDIVETIDEYMGSLGYRHYFWRGLHLETIVSAGAAWGTNRFDGKDYTTFALFMDVNAGYRIGFFEPGGFLYDGDETVGLYAIAQGGIIFSLGVADIGPRDGKPDYFPQGAFIVGVSF